MWANGRWGGMKRGVFSPSCGKIRRTYHYRAQPCRYTFSFVGWKYKRTKDSLVKSGDFFLLPEDEETEEESLGLLKLDLWRSAIDSLAKSD
jgi:hypothetical protein